MPGRGWPRSSVVTALQALVGTIPNAELEVVIAAVCGPAEPLAARVSVPMVVEFEMLVPPRPHDESEATLWPLSVMWFVQSPPLDALLKIEFANELEVLDEMAPPVLAKNVSK